MKTAFMFSGQGVEKTPMCKELYDNFDVVKEVFDRANKALGYDIKEICFNDEEKLKETKNAQPALLTTSYSILELLRSKNIDSDYYLGLSLGEYTALVASNAIDFEQGVSLVNKRGKLMEESFLNIECGMVAVLKTPIEVLENVINESEKYGLVEIANYNTPNQTIISGELKGLKKAIELLKDKKYKTIKLNVKGAFHTSLLEEASKKLKVELEKLDINDFDKPVVSNVTADFIKEKEELVNLLTMQIKSQVKFYQSIEKLIDNGVTTFVELGTGKTLASFVKKINKEVKVFHIEDIKTLNAFLESRGE